MTVRQRSIWKIGLGAAAFTLAFMVFDWLETADLPTVANRIILFIIALPVGIGIAGLLELITGLPFLALAKSWDSLKGWQRGVIGLGAIGLVIAVMALIASIYLSSM